MTNSSSNATTATTLPSPDQLVGDVQKRDREWATWEQHAVEVMYQELARILGSNYPGQGWLQITIRDINQDVTGVANALCSSFGRNLEGLFINLEHIFKSLDWRIVCKTEEYRICVCYFQPLANKLSWREQRGWINAAAQTYHTINNSLFNPPPQSLRPNHRGFINNYSNTLQPQPILTAASSEPFIYDNFC